MDLRAVLQNVRSHTTQRVVDTHRVGDENTYVVTVPAAEHARAAASATPGDSAEVRSKTRRRAREYQRIAVRCGCWLEHDQATVYGTTVDLGRGGLFLRTALPMPPGVSVRVTLHLPGHETVVADGKIVRAVSPRTGDRPGLGVHFEHLPDGDDSLCAFLFGTMRDQQESGESAERDAVV